MRLPEALHGFIAESYNKDELDAILSDQWGFPEAVNNTQFVGEWVIFCADQRCGWHCQKKTVSRI